MIMVEISETLTAINNQYKIYELNRQCHNAEVMRVEVTPYTRVLDQIPTPNAKISQSLVVIS